MPVKRYDGANWVTVAGEGVQGPTGPAGASATTVVTTKGDLLVATGSATIARQGVGANATVLTADSTLTNGIKWAAIDFSSGSQQTEIPFIMGAY
jgi:hypothetical protein